MPADTIKATNAFRATWAAAIERTKLAKTEKKRLAVGVSWEQGCTEKGLELRLSILRRWPFVRPSITVGTVPPQPPMIWEEIKQDDCGEVERIEAEKESAEHWVAPGESRKSSDGVVGVDRSHVWWKR